MLFQIKMKKGARLLQTSYPLFLCSAHESHEKRFFIRVIRVIYELSRPSKSQILVLEGVFYISYHSIPKAASTCAAICSNLKPFTNIPCFGHVA